MKINSKPAEVSQGIDVKAWFSVQVKLDKHEQDVNKNNKSVDILKIAFSFILLEYAAAWWEKFINCKNMSSRCEVSGRKLSDLGFKEINFFKAYQLLQKVRGWKAPSLRKLLCSYKQKVKLLPNVGLLTG